MVELTVEGLGRAPSESAPFLVLRERGGPRRLVLQIGMHEATAIALALGRQKPPRPLAADVLAQAVERLAGDVRRVLIHDLRDDTFVGSLEIGSERGLLEVDCRPSDGVALALRMDAPIYASEEVLAEAAVLPATLDDAGEQGDGAGAGPADP